MSTSSTDIANISIWRLIARRHLQSEVLSEKSVAQGQVRQFISARTGSIELAAKCQKTQRGPLTYHRLELHATVHEGFATSYHSYLQSHAP